mgnify:CR=1 FL=1
MTQKNKRSQLCCPEVASGRVQLLARLPSAKALPHALGSAVLKRSQTPTDIPAWRSDLFLKSAYALTVLFVALLALPESFSDHVASLPQLLLQLESHFDRLEHSALYQTCHGQFDWQLLIFPPNRAFTIVPSIAIHSQSIPTSRG